MKKTFIMTGSILALATPVTVVVACSNKPEEEPKEAIAINFDSLIKFEGTLKTEEIKSAIAQIIAGNKTNITFNGQKMEFENYVKGEDENKDKFIDSIVNELKKYYPNALEHPPKGFVDTGKLVWEKDTFIAPLPTESFKVELPKAPENTEFLASSDQLYMEDGKSVWRALEGYKMPIHFDFEKENSIIFNIKLVAKPGYHIKDEQIHQISFTKNNDAPEKIDKLGPSASVDRISAVDGQRIKEEQAGLYSLTVQQGAEVKAEDIEKLISYTDNIDEKLAKTTDSNALAKGIHYLWTKEFDPTKVDSYRLKIYAIDSSGNRSINDVIIDVNVKAKS